MKKHLMVHHHQFVDLQYISQQRWIVNGFVQIRHVHVALVFALNNSWDFYLNNGMSAQHSWVPENWTAQCQSKISGKLLALSVTHSEWWTVVGTDIRVLYICNIPVAITVVSSVCNLSLSTYTQLSAANLATLSCVSLVHQLFKIKSYKCSSPPW